MSDRISEHITLKEGIKSHTATRLNIDNIPRELDLINMKTIAEEVFEPLRKFVGGPIAINSFYRSPKLNSAIGGSTTSQHCIGCAFDLNFSWVKIRLAQTVGETAGVIAGQFFGCKVDDCRRTTYFLQ